MMKMMPSLPIYSSTFGQIGMDIDGIPPSSGFILYERRTGVIPEKRKQSCNSSWRASQPGDQWDDMVRKFRRAKFVLKTL